jgi:RNA polymerase-binding transcription factor DksA
MEAVLSAEDLRRYERRLRDELAGHAVQIDEIESESLEPSGAERFQDVDESVEDATLEVDLATLAAQDQLGQEVREALERIASGTFGRCESCSRPIARERLDLVPWARLCESCAREQESLPRG